MSLLPYLLAKLTDHLAQLGVALLLIVALGGIERMFPAEPQRGLRGRARNFGFIALYQLAGGAMVSLFAYFVLPHLLLTTEPHPTRSPLGLAGIILAYVFAGDLLFYWYHRAQHGVEWLWPIHELHHADDELNATSSLRTYLLDRPVQFVVISLPIAVFVAWVPALRNLQLTADEAGILYLVSLTWLFVAHANLRLELGRWSWVATGPQVHRIHHSVEPQHRDRNFSQFFPIIDVVFGTYRAPARGEFPKTGTPALASAATLPHVIARPFRVWFSWSSTHLGPTPFAAITDDNRRPTKP